MLICLMFGEDEKFKRRTIEYLKVLDFEDDVEIK